ncbi:MAG: hypothetical protein AAGH79_02675, partial [Bacteroidota bacterium]
MRHLALLAFSLFTISLLAQPINDDCSGIIDLGVGPSCTDEIYNNIDATPSTVFSNPALNIPTCWPSVTNDVWFVFEPLANGSLIDFLITLTGTDAGPNNMALTQPALAVYRGECGIDELDELACVTAGAGATEVSVQLEGL